MIRRLLLILALLMPLPPAISPLPALAQDRGEAETAAPKLPPPPYEARLQRLSEILGSIQYLRNLCNSEDEPGWRESMQALLDSETADEPDRRAQLTAGYNRGFRAFASVYTTCTASALVAEERYRHEGATLIAELVARYGN